MFTGALTIDELCFLTIFSMCCRAHLRGVPSVKVYFVGLTVGIVSSEVFEMF